MHGLGTIINCSAVIAGTAVGLFVKGGLSKRFEQTIFSAVGLAVINTVLDHRTDLHISRLHERVNWGNSVAVETLNMLTQKFQGAGNASLMALKQLSQIVHRQAVVMSFGDAFFILTCFYLVLSTLVFFVRKPNMMGPPPDAH